MSRPMEPEAKIYVAGHRGLVGSALVRGLRAAGYRNLLCRSSAELDLTRQRQVERFFERERPDYVLLAAARVGGIAANNRYPADFIRQNLEIQGNVIAGAWRSGVKRLLFLGSSCIYPRLAAQPLREEYLLTGPLEPTNRPYAVAKIAGIEMCWSCNRQYGTSFLAVMPTNLYGPGDNFDLEGSHVIPAMLRKFHLARLAEAGRWPEIEADEARHGAIPEPMRQQLAAAAAGRQAPAVVLWGSGAPRREFLYSEEMAAACLFLLSLPEKEFVPLLGRERNDGVPPVINIGCGEDLTIRELAELVRQVVGYRGEVLFDAAQPDGTPRKLLDISRLHALGWRPAINLEQGLRLAYQAYQASA